MKRFIVPSLTALMLVAFSAGAAAEGTTTQAGREGSVGASDPPPQNAAPQPAIAEPQTTTSGEATPAADAKTEARLKVVRDKGGRMPVAERDEIEKKLAESGKDVDVEAVTNGDATVADRFAAEFGVTSEALLAERTQNNVGWGDVMIARTLLASAPSGTTIGQLYTLHAEGMGWGQIAHGFGLRAGSVAAAVKTEAMVARGTVKADGKPAKIGKATRVASAGKARARSGQAKAGAATGTTAGTGTTTSTTTGSGDKTGK